MNEKVIKKSYSNLKKSKIFCPVPWFSIAVEPTGQIRPCCQYSLDDLPEDLNTFHNDPLNHKYIKDLREKMINEVSITNCNKCYRDEEKKNFSLRIATIDTIEKFSQLDLNKSIISIDDASIIYLDVDINNVCNLKCRMCSPKYSTSWYSDAKKLNLPIPRGSISHNTFLENVDLSKVKSIKLSGGESLLSQEDIIRLIKKTNVENLFVQIISNLTVLPNDELYSLLKKCEKLTIVGSIDAYGDLNNFLRKGSNWDQIISNLDWYYNNNINLVINSVVSIYNVNCFEILIDYIKNRYPNVSFHHLQMAETDYGGTKNWMDPCNLPLQVKKELLEKIKNIKNNYNLPIFFAVEKSLECYGNFEEFIKFDNKLNSLRKEHWKDLNAELYDMITPFMSKI
jgi:MoaA/NifB/PqqE/SkfB family radical SAM enzyme